LAALALVAALGLGLLVAGAGSDSKPRSSRALVLAMAPTPPMGWSSWYGFDCRDNEALVVRTAQAIKASGMGAAGYRYLVVDDCWMTKGRDSHGALQANRQLFPHGIAWLATYVHGLGLKLGLYLDTGTATCTGWAGSAGRYQQDANTVAAWGVDYVKLDYCTSQPAPPAPTYAQFRHALDETGKSIILNISDWGWKAPWSWATGIGSTWRTNRDYFVYGALNSYWKALLEVADIQVKLGLARYAQPGAFNDPNNMLIGTGVLTGPEERTQMSLWAVLAAPLFAGGDLSKASAETLQVLSNRDVIEVDQDPAGRQGTRVEDQPRHQVWLRHLRGGAEAVVMLNTGASPAVLEAGPALLGLQAGRRYSIRDLWGHRSWVSAGPLTARVAPHDVAMFRVS
jgi:alpha-galactosidase